MRTSSMLTLALVPAALFAQAPPAPAAATTPSTPSTPAAPLMFAQRYKAEQPAIDQLLKDFHFQEALARAEAMLPASAPAFDASTVPAGRASSVQFSYLASTYQLAARAAVYAGLWEKGLGHFLSARELARTNLEQTTQVVTPALATWKTSIEAGRKALDEGAARFKELSEKTPLTPAEDSELRNLQVHKQNLANGEKITRVLNRDLADIQKELDGLKTNIENTQKAIADEKAEMDEKLPGKPFKGSKAKYLAAMLNPKSLEIRETKLNKLTFLCRLQVLTAGTPEAAKIKAVLDRVAQDQDPFPAVKRSKKN